MTGMIVILFTLSRITTTLYYYLSITFNMESKKQKIIDDLSNYQKKKVVTEGDAKVKTLQTLCIIEEMSNSLCKVILEFEKVMKDPEYRATPKKMIAILSLIKSVSLSLKDGIRSVSCLQKKKNLIQNLISESKAEFNVDSKRSKLLNIVTISKGTAEVRYMNYLMKALKNDYENTGETKSNTTLVRKVNT